MIVASPFRFSVLSWKHKKWFLINKIGLLIMLGLMTYIAVDHTNPVLVTRDEKMSVSMGVMIGVMVMLFALFNLFKNIAKTKFLLFFVIWFILMAMQPVMSTLIWAVGLNTIPLAINDLIFAPIWGNVWYNQYER
jgi:hypothetical protein